MNFEGKWETKLLCFIAANLTIVTIRYIVIFRSVRGPTTMRQLFSPVLEMQHWHSIRSFAESHLTEQLPTLWSWRWWSFSRVITIGEVWHHYSLEMKMESMVWKNSMLPAEEEFQTSRMWYSDSLILLLRVVGGHVLWSLSLPGWAIGPGNVFPTHRTALTRPFQTFACLANWHHTSKVLGCHLVTQNQDLEVASRAGCLFLLQWTWKVSLFVFTSAWISLVTLEK